MVEVMKPNCLVAQTLALTLGNEIKLADDEDPLVLGKRVSDFYMKFHTSLIPYFLEKEFPRMALAWCSYLVSRRISIDAARRERDDEAVPSVSDTPRRTRRAPQRFKPSHK